MHKLKTPSQKAVALRKLLYDLEHHPGKLQKELQRSNEILVKLLENQFTLYNSNKIIVEDMKKQIKRNKNLLKDN